MSGVKGEGQFCQLVADNANGVEIVTFGLFSEFVGKGIGGATLRLLGWCDA